MHLQVFVVPRMDGLHPTWAHIADRRNSKRGPLGQVAPNAHDEHPRTRLRNEVARINRQHVTGVPSCDSWSSAPARSLPPWLVAKPCTFSRRITGGRPPSISLRIRANSQNIPDCEPARPNRLPAKERSTQGKLLVASSRPFGRSAADAWRTSPSWKCSRAEWFAPRTRHASPARCRSPIQPARPAAPQPHVPDQSLRRTRRREWAAVPHRLLLP